MTATPQILEKCRRIISQPAYRKEYLLGVKKCKPITGYFSNYIPEEIIAAAGLHPLRIIGRFDASQSRQPSLFNPVCSFVQDVYLAASQGEFSFLKNIVFPNSCDSLKALRQMWEYEIKKPKAYTLLHPINANDDSIKYFAHQLRTFAGEMKKDTANDFSDAELKKTIDKYNHTRGLLRRLYDIRKTNTFINSSDVVVLMTAGLILERDEYNTILQQIVDEGLKYNQSNENENLKRIMIIGPLVDNYELLNTIERLGAIIIDDDITNGSRYCSRDVETEGDLYENLAERYLFANPSPTLNSDITTDQKTFADRIDKLNPDGVLYINQKFCEPHIHNYLAKLEILRQKNINMLLLEVEHAGSAVSERDLLRIESFLEIAQRS